MEIRRIKRANVSDQVLSQMKRMLADGEWAPGDRLPSEKELADGFGVSRVTVRQALQQLYAWGLVETRLGEGSFVRQPQAGDYVNGLLPVVYLGQRSLLEALEFRQTIEPKTAQLAAARMTEEDVDQLEHMYRQMQAVKEDHAAFGKVDLEFHLALSRMTRNSLLIATNSLVGEVLGAAMQRIIEVRGWENGLYYHGKLLEAARRRDGEAMFHIMQEHVDDTYRGMAAHLRRTDM
ncbi:MAG: FadR/GntR family transcriptional regulator [Eubacteriales bacterium]|jgi:GntR family transcriptional repressor for pyruvate dehydrogenase complex